LAPYILWQNYVPWTSSPSVITEYIQKSQIYFIDERIEYKLLSLTYKVYNQPT